MEAIGRTKENRNPARLATSKLPRKLRPNHARCVLTLGTHLVSYGIGRKDTHVLSTGEADSFPFTQSRKEWANLAVFNVLVDRARQRSLGTPGLYWPELDSRQVDTGVRL